ncbi:sulfotransferase [Sphingomonas sp. HT-1]|uniref:tetratricopeptide repeat-containing sulfotransferase family protein n=1 Tax=Sphingomonas sp. HT-1 TaxID=3400348 RepID=UPI00031F6ECB
MKSASSSPASEPSALSQAVRLAQAGDLLGAQALAEAALAGSSDAAPLRAFLGMVCARRGALETAAVHLAEAAQLRPDDVTIACNRIAIEIDRGNHADALDIATMARATADPSLRIARYRGFLAQSLSRFEEAVEAYAFVIARVPNDVDSLNNLGNARAAIGDLDGAIAVLERAVATDPAAAPTRINLALTYRAAGRGDDAETTLRDAARDFPQDARPLHELYIVLKEQARHEPALEALEAAAIRDPADMAIQLKLAIEYGIMMETEKAEQAYLRVLEHRPNEQLAYLGLAIHYEHHNRGEDLAPLAARAEANGIDAGTRAFLAALDHRRADRFQEALGCLELVPADIEPERTAHLRATVLDRLGRTDEAFYWIEETGRRHAAHESAPLLRAEALRTQVRSEIGRMTPAWVNGWTRDPVFAGQDPVFLLGFPRSGTTLLDTILMGHPETVVLEEKPALNVVEDAIGGMDALAAMDEAAIDAARAHYFSEVARYTALPSGRMLVDKSPLYLYKVPLIRRLFPKARIILALRHPCDVLLSCLMSNFRLNRAMSNFLRLEDAADFYDASFAHWERAQLLFDVPVRTIVYERLVQDVEAEVRPLFDWLDLSWTAAALDHQRTARERGLITTASYSQVTEPIYQRAAGRWHRYRDHLAPIFPKIAPWVTKFGYKL